MTEPINQVQANARASNLTRIGRMSRMRANAYAPARPYVLFHESGMYCTNGTVTASTWSVSTR